MPIKEPAFENNELLLSLTQAMPTIRFDPTKKLRAGSLVKNGYIFIVVTIVITTATTAWISTWPFKVISASNNRT
jgi:hypothetical protein